MVRCFTVPSAAALHVRPCAPGLAGGTHLAEVARVELVHHDPVVVLATSVTAAAGMLSVLAHATMAGTDVPALLTVLLESCMHERDDQRQDINCLAPRLSKQQQLIAAATINAAAPLYAAPAAS